MDPGCGYFKEGAVEIGEMYTSKVGESFRALCSLHLVPASMHPLQYLHIMSCEKLYMQ